ncbi:MAG: hypothetical protein JJT89_02685 [Nitriliruptoraceae bacterium]|nr:hypothetical protein [Nitriliruptoraceae bacterium]
MRTRWSRPTRALATTAVAALLVTACGGSDDPGQAEADDDGVEAADPVDDTEDTDDTVDADESSDGDAADDDPDAPLFSSVGSDGWAEPETTDLPPPGTLELELGGQSYTVDIECRGFGEVPDEVDDGAGIPRPLNDFIPFAFEVSAFGQDDDGRNFRLTVGRSIFIRGDRAIQIRNSDWGGDGQFDIVSFSNDDGVSRQQTPSSRDPEGSELPLVRVNPEGAFTARGELRPEFEGEDDAPDGPFELRGQCQETWPEPFEG